MIYRRALHGTFNTGVTNSFHAICHAFLFYKKSVKSAVENRPKAVAVYRVEDIYNRTSFQ